MDNVFCHALHFMVHWPKCEPCSAKLLEYTVPQSTTWLPGPERVQ